MEINTRSNKALWPVSIGLAAVFLLAGALKIARIQPLVDQFAAWGYPEPLLMLVGLLELLGAILLLVPRIASVGAILLGGVMLGAASTHLIHGAPLIALLPLAMLGVIAFIGHRRLDTSFANQTNRSVPLPRSRRRAHEPQT